MENQETIWPKCKASWRSKANSHGCEEDLSKKKQENPHTGIDQDKNSNSSSKAGVWRQRQSSSSD